MAPSRHRACIAMLVFVAVIVAITLYLSNSITAITWASRSSENVPSAESASNTLTSYGKSKHPLDDLTLTASIPPQYMPTAKNGRRLLVIGDIHGMNTELGQLLDLAKYNPSNDHVVTLGDMVNKGPHSRDVLSRLMSLNASAVRGNHEDRLLLALKQHHRRASPHEDEVIDFRKHNKKILKVAKTLLPEQIKWLSHLPVILKANPLKLYFVHGGLVPGVKLEKQDPWAVMNMRTLLYPRSELNRLADSSDQNPISNDGADAKKVIAIPIEDHSGERWTKAWDRYVGNLGRRHRRTVMYGHDAKRGFTEGKYTVGLDSACVAGGHLTGLLVTAEEKKGFAYSRVQVPCKAAWKPKIRGGEKGS